MRRCLSRLTCFGALQRPIRISKGLITTPRQRSFAVRNFKHPDNANRESAWFTSRYDVFKRETFPGPIDKRNLNAWLSLLERGLPPHLREDGGPNASSTLGPVHVAEILLAAQRRSNNKEGIDLLYYLAIEKGRWRAVVWLVKLLVDKFAPLNSDIPRLSSSTSSWSSERSLYEITNDAINVEEFVPSTFRAPVSSTKAQTLEDITDDLKPETLSRDKVLRHDALGSIWRSIGVMSIACAGSEIRPEILEIIAYLHHMGIMPISIYSQRPRADPTAIQQPLMLHLFSSRILTSLSDAAWRAHEKLIVEAAKAKGGEQSSLRPEIPGSAYRVYVAGLKSEVWLELILWLCLHGGWIAEGASILRVAYNTPGDNFGVPKWKPLSWRSLADDVEGEQDWHELESLFNTQTQSKLHGSQPNTTLLTRRTVSSEVVNAYVDALLGTVRLGLGERGIDPASVLGYLQELHQFLGRSELSLGTGSWDAIVLRFYDVQESVVNQTNLFKRLVSLSPNMAEELSSDNIRPLPAYVLDGSAAVIGLFHRALRSRIVAGDVHGALHLFESLQTLADRNKRKSVLDFLEKQRALESDGAALVDKMFTNNFAGIEYPAFNVQLPSTILGPFLELVTDAKAYTFGKWLLYSDEIDGPVISEQHYGDPAIAPALVRFAAETNDTALLSKLIRTRSLQTQGQGDEPTLPRHILQSFFESQVNLNRWDAAVRILEYMRDREYMYWNFISIACVIRVMLLHVRGAEDGKQDSQRNFNQAKILLSDMIQGKYEHGGERPQYLQDQMDLLLIMLSTLNRTWAEFSLNLQDLQGAYSFNVTVKAFNLFLEGAVDAYGSYAGQRLIDRFWPASARKAQKAGRRVSGEETNQSIMTRFVPNVLDQPNRKRTVIQIPGRPLREITFYGSLEPDLMTINTVFRKAIEESKRQGQAGEDVDGFESNLRPADFEADSDGDEVVSRRSSSVLAWAIRCFRSMRMSDDDIRDELNSALSEDEMSWVREEMRDLFYDSNDRQESVEEIEFEN